MKTIDTVKTGLIELFTAYRCEYITAYELFNKADKLCKARGKKSYWWRYFINDTGANTPLSMYNSLLSYRSKAHEIECMDLSLETKQLTIYLS